MRDTANPEPMHPASEKMSQWMNSYMPTVMNKIMSRSVTPTNMGMGNQSGARISDMFFKAIHPDTGDRRAFPSRLEIGELGMKKIKGSAGRGSTCSGFIQRAFSKM
jgi:hypothetical protein